MIYQHKRYNHIDGFFVAEERIPFGSGKSVYAVIEVYQVPVVDFPRYAINVQELINSERQSGDFKIIEPNHFALEEYEWIDPEPVTVIHHRSHISWTVGAPVFKRCWAFERKQYRQFVRKMKQHCIKITADNHCFRSYDFKFHPWNYTEWPLLKETIRRTETKPLSL